jgi:protocatechuate 3,4-dioxygenase beta subunit
LLDDENVTRNNFKFRVHTTISYVDDPYDGYSTCPCASGPAQGKPKDLYPYDYKKSEISVYLRSSGQRIAMVTTDVAGKAAETSSNTGILNITVLNASGQPVANANVHIVNTVPNPDVDITTTTDNNGVVVIPKLPPDSGNNYQVTASLAGYSTDGTIPDPPGAQVAVKLNPNVLAQQITSLTMAIDQLATMSLHVVDTDGNPVSGLAVTTTGAKQIKTNPVVYKYSQPSTTDASGNISLTAMEWDGYSFGVPSGRYVVTVSPYAPVALQPNSSKSVNLVVSTSSSWPTITKAAPASGATGSNPLSLVITGTNLTSSSTLKLKLSGQSDITASSCVSSGGNTTLTCSLNLTGAAQGNWDIDVTVNGKDVIQTGGFSVTP